ncbi:MAG: pilus assembly protein [Chloroflexi bacterium]|nr:pilus assembly protein [Chloroflexota bacterium]
MNHVLPDNATEGQGLVEYALIITLIALAVVVSVTALGGGVVSIYQNKITASLTSVGM